MKHYNVVAAVVCHDGKYLCMQKGKTKFEYTSYKWEFPGGKIEPGETVNHEYPDFSITMTAFLCTPKGDANGFKRREHADSKWCSKDELKGLNWAAADIDVVEGIL